MVSSNNSDSETESQQNTICNLIPECTSPHDGKVLLNEVLSIHIDQLFTLLFTWSNFYLDFQATRRNSELAQTPWTHDPESGCKKRVVTMKFHVEKPLGPKFVNSTETQTMLPCSKPGYLYAIDQETVNVGVPYADSFYVLNHYCLKKISDNQCSINVNVKVIYTKNIWSVTKGIIEKATFSGIESYYRALKEKLLPECESNSGGRKRKCKRRKDHKQLSSGMADKTGPYISCDVNCFKKATFALLVIMIFVNVALYQKVQYLEKIEAMSPLDFLKQLPQAHDQWLHILHQQEVSYFADTQKWKNILTETIDSLKEAEQSMAEMKKVVGISKSSKIMKPSSNLMKKREF